METRIKTVVPYKGELKIIELFGIVSKGLPGIYIVGPRKMTRTLKEKFLYLSRFYQIKIPIGRYQLCVDETIDWGYVQASDALFVELPLFLMFLKLAGVLKFSHLEDCLCAGTISISGECSSATFQEEELRGFEEGGHKIITNQKTEIEKKIDLGQILSEVFLVH